MTLKTTKNSEIIHFNKLKEFSAIKHFVSTRLGGFSEPPYDGLNLGFKTEDKRENVLKNRHKLAELMETDLGNFCFANQVHENIVSVITEKNKGKGAFDYKDAITQTDAMVSNIPGICLFVMAADCTPLLFFDPVKKVIGATHAGWKGTVKKIAVETVKKMHKVFDSNFKDIIVGIGPCISVEIYEVGEEVREAVIQAFGTDEGYMQLNPQSGKYHFDLKYTNRQQLIDMGIRSENIEISPYCTFQNSDLFFSSRKGKGITGRFGAGIMLVV